jgi:uncharacterized protein YjbI with pentapeptide repeats
MSSDHVPGAVPQAEQHSQEVPLGRVSLGAVPLNSGPVVDSGTAVRDLDVAQAVAVIESAVESLAPPPPPPPEPRDNTTDADRAAVRATFEDLAALHVSPVRNLMLEVRWGEAPTRFIAMARPALQSLQSMAGALELDDLVKGIAGFDAALGAALASGQDKITGDTREALLGAYFPLQSGFATAFGLEGGRGKERREPIVVDALLDGVPGVDQAVLDQLSLVGLGRLEPLLKARAEEIAVVSGIPRTVAQRIVDRVKERVQAAPRALATQSRGPRPSSAPRERGEPRTVLEWLTLQLLREQTLMRLRRGEAIERADLRGADLEGAVLHRLELRRAQLGDAHLVGADLGGADLESADLRGARLERANLMGANLSRADLTGADLTGANLRGARLSFATLSSANLTGATVRDATLKHADLEWACLRHATGAGANFSGAHMQGAVLESGDFSRARMDEADLELVEAAGASFVDTTFAGASLRLADLSGADLRTADLRRAALDGANFSGALVTGLHPSGLHAEGLRIDALVVGALNGAAEVPTTEVAACMAAVFTGLGGGAPALPSGKASVARTEYLNGARLLFTDGADVTVHGLLEQCLLQLGPSTDLTIAPDAALIDCRILGGRRITIAGAVLDGPTSPIPLVEPRAITVAASGVLAGQVQQPTGRTCFAFERGSRLRLRILGPVEQP